jgi:hypothetical protein
MAAQESNDGIGMWLGWCVLGLMVPQSRPIGSSHHHVGAKSRHDEGLGATDPAKGLT